MFITSITLKLYYFRFDVTKQGRGQDRRPTANRCVVYPLFWLFRLPVVQIFLIVLLDQEKLVNIVAK